MGPLNVGRMGRAGPLRLELAPFRAWFDRVEHHALEATHERLWPLVSDAFSLGHADGLVRLRTRFAPVLLALGLGLMKRREHALQRSRDGLRHLPHYSALPECSSRLLVGPVGHQHAQPR